SMNIFVQLKLRTAIMPLMKAARSCMSATLFCLKYRSSSRRLASYSERSSLIFAVRARTSVAALRTEYTCHPNARKTAAATKAERLAPARKCRCDSTGFVTKLSRTCISYQSPQTQRNLYLTTMQHPANQSIQVKIGRAHV